MTEIPGVGAAHHAASPGAVLAAARKARGLSIEDVAVQMRISPRQVQAIEADQYDKLPGPVFVRGFVRNYARLLTIDPVPLLHSLEPALDTEAPLRAQEFSGALPVTARRSHTRLWIALLLALLSGVLAASAYELWRSRKARVAPTAVDLQAPSAPVPEPAPPPMSPDSPGATGNPAPQPTPEGSKPREEAASERPPESTPVGAPEVEARPAVTAGSNLLQVKFLSSSWLEVRDQAGKVIYAGTGASNTTRNFKTQGPLAVVVGNASGVKITYNDKAIDVQAHAARNIARLTLE